MLLFSQKIKNKIKVIRNDIDYINNWMFSLARMYEQGCETAINVPNEQNSFLKIYHYLDKIENNLDKENKETLKDSIDKLKFFMISYSIAFKNQNFQNEDIEFWEMKNFLINRVNELIELFF